MNLRRLVANAASSIALVIVVGVSYLFLYRYLLDTIGAEALGIWSVVLASSSLGRLSNLGLGASVLKHASRYVARKEPENVVAVVETGAIALGAFTGAALALLYPAAVWALPLFIPSHGLGEAFALLPWAFASLWILTVCGAYQSGIDGYERIDLRSGLTMTTVIIFVGLAVILVPDYGLLGLAYAQIAQNAIALVLSQLLLRTMVSGLGIVPRRWSMSIFKELIGYGLKIQFMAACAMLTEPITKALVARYAGLSATAWFEMSNRLMMQLRQLINAGARAIVPTVAQADEVAPDQVKRLYLGTYDALFFAVWPALGITLAAIPTISELWIGYYNPEFVSFAMIISTGVFIQMLCSPAYFANLGTGLLGSNIKATVTMLAAVCVGGLLSGPLVGGLGPVVSYAVAYLVGGMMILGSYHRDYGLGARSIVPDGGGGLILASVAGAAAALGTWYALRADVGLTLASVAALGVYAIVLVRPVWTHPMRQRLVAVAVRVLKPGSR